MEPKSKEEIARDVEQTRLQAKHALQNAGEVWTGKNAVASAWRSTKGSYFRAHDKVLETVENTDETIRTNLYSTLGIATGFGALLGFLKAGKSRKSAKLKDCRIMETHRVVHDLKDLNYGDIENGANSLRQKNPVQKNPYGFVAAAIVVGLLVGFFARRK